MNFRHLVRLSTGLVLLSTAAVHAAEITQVRENRVLITTTDLEGLIKGDELIASLSNGKRTAILKVSQIKGGKAIADVVKGMPGVGQSVTWKNGGPSVARDMREADFTSDAGEEKAINKYRDVLSSKYTGRSWGLMGEMIMTSMSAKVSTGSGAFKQEDTVAMKGNSFGLVGYYDFPILRNFHFRALGGYEPYNATGTSKINGCESGTGCSFNVTYLGAHGQAKFNFLETRNYRAWVLGGYGLMLAMAKSSNVIKTSDITFNQLFTGSVGADFTVSRKNYIPVAIEYGLFPSSETVSTSVITLRAGYAWLL